jgi:hypothetical protein
MGKWLDSIMTLETQSMGKWLDSIMTLETQSMETFTFEISIGM